MNIENNWEDIRRIFNKLTHKSFHCSVASVARNGSPHITPIGSLILRRDITGFYFEKHPKNLPENLKSNQQVCIMVVNSSLLFWLKSMFSTRFQSPPGLRLMGTVGERRLATEEELNQFYGRIKKFLFFGAKLLFKTKGFKMILGNLKYVRDIQFTSVKPVEVATMSQGLWEK